MAPTDSNDALIDNPTFANQAYPLNQYGRAGGYVQVPDVNTLKNTNSNEGEYDYTDATILNEGQQAARTTNHILIHLILHHIERHHLF